MMKALVIRANAKLNLSLDVTGVRDDGYHIVDMVNRSVTLFDEIKIELTPGSPFTIESNVRFFPTDEKNLIWKAARKLTETIGTGLPEARCTVRKRIPSQAGLGGGSADAAASLIGFNMLLDAGLNEQELCDIGASVGADVPFCVVGGTARVGGIGEEIHSIGDELYCPMLIAMPRYGRSTKEAYSMLDRTPDIRHPDTESVVRGLAAGDAEKAFAGAGNVFEYVTSDDVTEELKRKMTADGAVYSAMTGTGAAVFGVFQRPREALEARDLLRAEGYGSWVVYRADKGVEIVT
ncbi:MAG: 4-(cytidine 5'-diphospho)-2-C-methyl-D-erythritol kinase [Oscillospiraceae bacterium]|nr:4-(cytidine 5'-diphospho)-2-C-methyl-D-erythritol kinase [Oscillospiraceae bacterium]MBQ5412928.1 4-(cytidine 5'-diphospho)-2-C-methyl-D-erythritol kinase [Oscillospiraceae bacterium]